MKTRASRSNTAQKKKLTRVEKEEHIDEPDKEAEDYLYDEVDKFHASKDKMLFHEDEDSDAEDDLEEEVLGVDGSDVESSEEEEEEGASDEDVEMSDESQDDEHGIPSSKAWGKKKSMFYGGESLEGLQGFERDEAADLEEEEALRIQRRLNEEIDEDQFELIEPTQEPFETDSLKKDNKPVNVIRSDFSNLSTPAQWKLLSKESPELKDLIKDFKLKITELNDRINPLLDLVTAGKITGNGAIYVNTRFKLYTAYLINVAFYLSLKAKLSPVGNHPVVKRLVEYRTLINELEPLDEELEGQVDELLNYNVHDTETESPEIEVLSNEKPTVAVEQDDNEETGRKIKELGAVDPLKYYTALQERLKLGSTQDARNEATEEMEPDAEDDDDRRAINYTMSKNKGAHTKRRKLDRNPRVKHREMYRKAKIRRRGQIRTFRPEIEKYSGEASGIRAGVVRGVRIR
uniref:something about silencing protein 10 isoform X1 n=1 Tax=Ciona intestinalis TaxID=7719 RepID=UPI000180B307|nr:something about silencing protein 10 isoform X1 [Ciona intestinalis]XP_009862475.1 something about silencing protein 10 isoform X2 [Ciona intestinalis]|eukprot:XP_002120979.1 something about silencing protein 10 isoform X1 [Ciona intestinalis]